MWIVYSTRDSMYTCVCMSIRTYVCRYESMAAGMPGLAADTRDTRQGARRANGFECMYVCM